MVADIRIDYLNTDRMSRLGERGFGPGEFKEGNQSKSMSVFPVELGRLLGSGGRIPDDLINAVQVFDSRELVLRESRKEGEGEYLDRQIDLFLSRNPDWGGRLKSGEMADILEFGLEMTRAGAGNHNNLANPQRITEAFNIDNPPETKCAVFNRLFQVICERSMDRFNPGLREKYRMLVTKGRYSLDMPRTKLRDGEKMIPHAFFTLFSTDETGENIIYSTIDPYHAESAGDISGKLDFTRERGVDSINPIINLLLVKYWNGYNLSSEGERLKTLSLMGIMEVQTEAGNMGEIALILANQWEKINVDFRESKKDFDVKSTKLRERIAQYREEMEKIKNGVGSETFAEVLRQGCWNFYNGNISENYQRLRFKHQFVSELKQEFEGAIRMSVGAFVKEGGVTGDGEVDPRRALIFFDLMDSVGSRGIDLGSELWEETIQFVRSQRVANAEEWKRVIGAARGRREWNQHLVRHYKNSWNMRPVETVSLDGDKEEVDRESSRYQFTIFRAEVLKLMREAGINDWERFLPNNALPGSYEELFLKLLRNEED